MQFTYYDTFLTKNIDEQQLQTFEDEAIKAVSKINIQDNFYFEKLVNLKVYLFICAVLFEDETVQKKYKLYEEEYNTLVKKVQIKPSVRSVKLVRG